MTPPPEKPESDSLRYHCPYCDENPCRNIDHAYDQADYFATVAEDQMERAEAAEATIAAVREWLLGQTGRRASWANEVLSLLDRKEQK